jgi:hypothetical protein
MTPLVISANTTQTAGVLLLTILLVEFGGWYMLRIVAGRVPLTGFQKAFSRAGHAHAGVLVLFSLVAQLYADVADLSGIAGTVAHSAIPLAAILMPLGFFAASAGAGRTTPNRAIGFVYAGALALAIGVATLGLGLLAA